MPAGHCAGRLGRCTACGPGKGDGQRGWAAMRPTATARRAKAKGRQAQRIGMQRQEPCTTAAGLALPLAPCSTTPAPQGPHSTAAPMLDTSDRHWGPLLCALQALLCSCSAAPAASSASGRLSQPPMAAPCCCSTMHRVRTQRVHATHRPPAVHRAAVQHAPVPAPQVAVSLAAAACLCFAGTDCPCCCSPPPDCMAPRGTQGA